MDAQVQKQFDALRALYPDAKPELDFTNPYETLVATILSAQCTDKRVNMVTPAVFRDFPTANDMAKTTADLLYPYVRSCGFRTKAENIVAACKIIAENIESLGCQDRARLLRQGDSAALALLKKEGAQFDLIFLDPPYRMNMSDVCARLEKEGILAEDGIIIVEHAKENAPTPPDTLTLVDRREYGITGLSFFKRTGEE